MDIDQRISALEKRVKRIEKRLPGGGDTVEASTKKPESLVEFLKKRKPKNDTDRTICIAYFIEMKGKGGVKSVDSKSITTGFRDARLTVPTNVSDQLFRCAKKGFVQEGEEREGIRKVWKLTQTGIEYVDGLIKEE